MVFNRKRKENRSPSFILDDSPKRTKVQAQRKFAQGSNIISPVLTPVKELECQPRIIPEPIELLPMKRPNTEDFLTFLCFRGTPVLPPNLNFFNNASMVDTRRQSTESPSSSPKNGIIFPTTISKCQERPFIAFGVRKRADPIVVSRHMDKKRRHALALQALRRKYQEQKMAKIRAITISKLSERVQANKTVVRTTRSVTKSDHAISKKNMGQKTKITVVSTKRVKVTARRTSTLKPNVRSKANKQKMCLRSYRGRFVQRELVNKPAKKRSVNKSKDDGEADDDPGDGSLEEEFSSDDDEPLLKRVNKKASKKVIKKIPSDITYRLTRSNQILSRRHPTQSRIIVRTQSSTKTPPNSPRLRSQIKRKIKVVKQEVKSMPMKKHLITKTVDVKRKVLRGGRIREIEKRSCVKSNEPQKAVPPKNKKNDIDQEQKKEIDEKRITRDTQKKKSEEVKDKTKKPEETPKIEEKKVTKVDVKITKSTKNMEVDDLAVERNTKEQKPKTDLLKKIVKKADPKKPEEEEQDTSNKSLKKKTKSLDEDTAKKSPMNKPVKNEENKKSVKKSIEKNKDVEIPEEENNLPRSRFPRKSKEETKTKTESIASPHKNSDIGEDEGVQKKPIKSAEESKTIKKVDKKTADEHQKVNKKNSIENKKNIDINKEEKINKKKSEEDTKVLKKSIEEGAKVNKKSIEVDKKSNEHEGKINKKKSDEDTKINKKTIEISKKNLEKDKTNKDIIQEKIKTNKEDKKTEKLLDNKKLEVKENSNDVKVAQETRVSSRLEEKSKVSGKATRNDEEVVKDERKISGQSNVSDKNNEDLKISGKGDKKRNAEAKSQGGNDDEPNKNLTAESKVRRRSNRECKNKVDLKTDNVSDEENNDDDEKNKVEKTSGNTKKSTKKIREEIKKSGRPIREEPKATEVNEEIKKPNRPVREVTKITNQTNEEIKICDKVNEGTRKSARVVSAEMLKSTRKSEEINDGENTIEEKTSSTAKNTSEKLNKSTKKSARLLREEMKKSAKSTEAEEEKTIIDSNEKLSKNTKKSAKIIQEDTKKPARAVREVPTVSEKEGEEIQDKINEGTRKSTLNEEIKFSEETSKGVKKPSDIIKPVNVESTANKEINSEEEIENSKTTIEEINKSAECEKSKKLAKVKEFDKTNEVSEVISNKEIKIPGRKAKKLVKSDCDEVILSERIEEQLKNSAEDNVQASSDEMNLQNKISKDVDLSNIEDVEIKESARPYHETSEEIKKSEKINKEDEEKPVNEKRDEKLKVSEENKKEIILTSKVEVVSLSNEVPEENQIANKTVEVINIPDANVVSEINEESKERNIPNQEMMETDVEVISSNVTSIDINIKHNTLLEEMTSGKLLNEESTSTNIENLDVTTNSAMAHKISEEDVRIAEELIREEKSSKEILEDLMKISEELKNVGTVIEITDENSKDDDKSYNNSETTSKTKEQNEDANELVIDNQVEMHKNEKTVAKCNDLKLTEIHISQNDPKATSEVIDCLETIDLSIIKDRSEMENKDKNNYTNLFDTFLFKDLSTDQVDDAKKTMIDKSNTKYEAKTNTHQEESLKLRKAVSKMKTYINTKLKRTGDLGFSRNDVIKNCVIAQLQNVPNRNEDLGEGDGGTYLKNSNVRNVKDIVSHFDKGEIRNLNDLLNNCVVAEWKNCNSTKLTSDVKPRTNEEDPREDGNLINVAKCDKGTVTNFDEDEPKPLNEVYVATPLNERVIINLNESDARNVSICEIIDIEESDCVSINKHDVTKGDIINTTCGLRNMTNSNLYDTRNFETFDDSINKDNTGLHVDNIRNAIDTHPFRVENNIANLPKQSIFSTANLTQNNFYSYEQLMNTRNNIQLQESSGNVHLNQEDILNKVNDVNFSTDAKKYYGIHIEQTMDNESEEDDIDSDEDTALRICENASDFDEDVPLKSYEDFNVQSQRTHEENVYSEQVPPISAHLFEECTETNLSFNNKGSDLVRQSSMTDNEIIMVNSSASCSNENLDIHLNKNFEESMNPIHIMNSPTGRTGVIMVGNKNEEIFNEQFDIGWKNYETNEQTNKRLEEDEEFIYDEDRNFSNKDYDLHLKNNTVNEVEECAEHFSIQKETCDMQSKKRVLITSEYIIKPPYTTLNNEECVMNNITENNDCTFVTENAKERSEYSLDDRNPLKMDDAKIASKIEETMKKSPIEVIQHLRIMSKKPDDDDDVVFVNETYYPTNNSRYSISRHNKSDVALSKYPADDILLMEHTYFPMEHIRYDGAYGSDILQKQNKVPVIKISDGNGETGMSNSSEEMLNDDTLKRKSVITIVHNNHESSGTSNKNNVSNHRNKYADFIQAKRIKVYPITAKKLKKVNKIKPKTSRKVLQKVSQKVSRKVKVIKGIPIDKQHVKKMISQIAKEFITEDAQIEAKKKIVKKKEVKPTEGEECCKLTQRPSRKTKEAAAVYMEILGHKLGNEERDDVSIDSFPELPNVRKLEQREIELKTTTLKENPMEEDKTKPLKKRERKLPKTLRNLPSDSDVSYTAEIKTPPEKRFRQTRNTSPKLYKSFSDTDTESDLIPIKQSVIKRKSDTLSGEDKGLNKKVKLVEAEEEESFDESDEEPLVNLKMKKKLEEGKQKRECTKKAQNYLPLFSSSDDEEKYFHGFVKCESPPKPQVMKIEQPIDLLSTKDVGRRYGKEKVNMSNEQIEKWLNDSALAGMSVIRKENDEMLKFGEKIPTETSLENLADINTDGLKSSLLKPVPKDKTVCSTSTAAAMRPFSNERKTIFRKEKCQPSRNVNAFSVCNESSVYAFEADNEDSISTPFRRPNRRPSSTATSRSEDDAEQKTSGKFRHPNVIRVDSNKPEESNSGVQKIAKLSAEKNKSQVASTPMCPPLQTTLQKSKQEGRSARSCSKSLDRVSDASEEFKYKVPSSPSASSSSSAKLYKRNAKSRPKVPENYTPINVTEFPTQSKTARIVEAPVFHPNEKEFVDPMEYIEKIRERAQKFGICKIVPPPNFKPECKVLDDMRFTAYNQYVHKMMHRWGPNFRELVAIRKYLATQSINLKHPPWIGGMEIDLPRLYQTVQSLGGLKEVIEKKKWSKVSELMKIPKSAQDRVTKLDDIYCKYLLPYDTLSPDERDKLFDSVETEWAKRESKTLLKAQQNASDERKSEDEEMESEDEDESDIECIVKGRSMALNTFYRIARNSMATWFRHPEPSAQDVEEEFWKHVTTKKYHICVHSGSIDSGNWGYGFAVSKNSPFARHAWNLKVLTNNSGSVLRSMGPVMGLTVPTLHVGMVFSGCCWYRDPHGLPWIEYLHTGANKIWYGIPDTMSEKFHSTLLNLVPNYCLNKSIWLPSDTVMLPPELLVDSGVSLTRTVQKPGQFVVIFPKAFTSNICTGYVVSESVFFAPPHWLDSAEYVFEELRNSCEPSMFSYERLLLSIANDSRSDVNVLKQIVPSVEKLCFREKKQRDELKELGVTDVERLPLPDNKKKKKMNEGETEYACEDCRWNLFCSMVFDSQENGIYCLEHAITHLRAKILDSSKCRLMYTYDAAELDVLVKNLKIAIETKLQKKSNSRQYSLPTMVNL